MDHPIATAAARIAVLRRLPPHELNARRARKHLLTRLPHPTRPTQPPKTLQNPRPQGL
jgi:hypothetical protein